MKAKQAYDQIGVAMTCRSYQEYIDMFGLSRESLRGRKVLDLAAGASSFAAEASGLADVTACDPRYGLTAEQLEAEGEAEIETSTAKLERLQEQFLWDYYGNLSRHRAGRERSLKRFAEDFRTHGAARYAAGSLPKLPFEAECFDLALVSHFLFLYGEQFDYDFHRAAFEELVRVTRPGGEIRVYPLVTLKFEPYPRLDELADELGRRCGVAVRKERSLLPFIPDSEEMLVIRK